MMTLPNYVNTTRTNFTDCGDDIKRMTFFNSDVTNLELFSAHYQDIHGYLSIGVCLFGIVSNAMNVVVLTRRNMVTATNYILTALAVADIFTMMSYLPYAVYFYCVAVPNDRYPHARGWIVYLLFNTNFNITCHTIAMWLTVRSNGGYFTNVIR